MVCSPCTYLINPRLSLNAVALFIFSKRAEIKPPPVSLGFNFKMRQVHFNDRVACLTTLRQTFSVRSGTSVWDSPMIPRPRPTSICPRRRTGSGGSFRPAVPARSLLDQRRRGQSTPGARHVDRGPKLNASITAALAVAVFAGAPRPARSCRSESGVHRNAASPELSLGRARSILPPARVAQAFGYRARRRPVKVDGR